MKPNQQEQSNLMKSKQDNQTMQNSSLKGSNQKYEINCDGINDIELKFIFTKGSESFPFVLKAPQQQQQLDREEARRVSCYFIKKFLLFDGGFEPYFKAHTSNLNKGLQYVISILSIIARKK